MTERSPSSDRRARGVPRLAGGLRRALLTVCLLPFASAWAQEPQSSWSDVERVIAFGDVHGAADDLILLLRAVSAIDQDLHWSAGAAHVVSLGDLLDRGARSREVMDLLMRLQDEAAAAGGVLHVVLGNHEAMNLLGDLRYVTPAEFSAYEADEPAGLRERLRADWVARGGVSSGSEFDRRFPPGYFGQRAAFASDGRYGRWLLGLPVAIVIDDTLFMHGGPSRPLEGLSLEEINRRYRSGLVEYLSALDALEAASLVRVDDPFDERVALADQRRQNGSALPAEAVRRLAAADSSEMLGGDGPNWSRGAALCHEASEADVLRPLLEGLGVDRLVIGHTVARDGRVASRFDGAVIKLDTGMNRAAYQGHPAALLLEKGAARVVYADERGDPAAIPEEALRVTPSELDDEAVAAVLARGEIVVGAAREAGTIEVTTELDGRRVGALFVPARGDNVRRELAAYRLDRALHLGLVPATVERAVNGRGGFLQARPPRSVTQVDVESQSLRPNGACAIGPQFELMYAFDALIGNQGRTRERMLYDADWMLLLTGHDRAFGTAETLPRGLPARPGAEMRRRLAALDAPTLERAVGELLGERERTALLARRDALLAAGTASNRR